MVALVGEYHVLKGSAAAKKCSPGGATTVAEGSGGRALDKLASLASMFLGDSHESDDTLTATVSTPSSVTTAAATPNTDGYKHAADSTDSFKTDRTDSAASSTVSAATYSSNNSGSSSRQSHSVMPVHTSPLRSSPIAASSNYSAPANGHVSGNSSHGTVSGNAS